MIVLELKIEAKQQQYDAIDDAIRTVQFIRNKCIRFWMDNHAVNKYDLSKYCADLAKEFEFADELNSMARQASAERAWSAISRFYDNCKKKIPGKKGYPKFKKYSRSVEYKTSGWKLDETKRYITFTDGKNIGKLKLIGTRDLNFYQIQQIKRVRLVRRADGYYCQFCISVDVKIEVQPTGKAVGLDMGIESFYTDSNGHKEENPRFYRKSEKQLKRLQRWLSRKFKLRKNKGDRQSNNYHKARKKLAKKHLKISRQRNEHAKRLARCVILSNDVVAYEDLRVRNMVKNHCLAKSISDAGWYQFRVWLEYFGGKFGKVTIAVSPQYTSQECSNCGTIVQKSLSTRTHNCLCGFILCRDQNAALNILKKALRTLGHSGTFALDAINAWGDLASIVVGENLLQQVESSNQESPDF